MKQLVKKLQNQKLKEVRAELSRAHLIIALLSIAIVVLLTLVQTVPEKITLDPTLSGISVALLLIVSVISLVISVALRRLK